MLLRNLPEVILHIVIRECLAGGGDKACDLKRNLPLLAVCRLWRHLAVPLVYSDVFVRYDEPPMRRGRPFARNPNAGSADHAVTTNLDLIAMVSCVRAVKKLRIDVHYADNPFPGWREVIQRLRTVASQWRVVKLTVSMDPAHYYSMFDRFDLVKYAEDVAEVGDALAALMPGVCHMECGGDKKDQYAWSLFGRLANHYADKLQRLNSQLPMIAPQGCQFTRLKEIDLGYGDVDDYQAPQMATGELVDMSLADAPADHSWASFSTDSDSQVVEFTKLKRLHASYPAVYVEGDLVVRHRRGHPWKLHFPNLENLSIFCTQDFCPLLEYAVLPPRMESISITMNASVFQDNANLALPETKCLSLGIFGLGRDQAGLLAINNILENVRGSKTLELVIHSMNPVVPESITCTSLTLLMLTAPTGVDSMLAFIERLPNLVYLTFYHLCFNDIQTELSVPGADEDADVERLHSSLEGLALNHSTSTQPSSMAVVVVKYLLLRIPTLTELLAAQVPESPVLEFVEAYAPRYPHLGDVELTLNNDGNFANRKWGFSE